MTGRSGQDILAVASLRWMWLRPYIARILKRRDEMTETDHPATYHHHAQRRAAPRRSGHAALPIWCANIGLDPKKVAVERNLEIVPRSTLAAVMLADGDKLEIVHFVGGG